jgi:hypothetical protein
MLPAGLQNYFAWWLMQQVGTSAFSEVLKFRLSRNFVCCTPERV